MNGSPSGVSFLPAGLIASSALLGFQKRLDSDSRAHPSILQLTYQKIITSHLSKVCTSHLPKFFFLQFHIISHLQKALYMLLDEMVLSSYKTKSTSQVAYSWLHCDLSSLADFETKQGTSYLPTFLPASNQLVSLLAARHLRC
jgi:hypothetical protein